MMSNRSSPIYGAVEKGAPPVSAADNPLAALRHQVDFVVGNVLLRQLSAEADGAETILFSRRQADRASASNVFIVRRGVIESPPKGKPDPAGNHYDVIVELATRERPAASNSGVRERKARRRR